MASRIKELLWLLLSVSILHSTQSEDEQEFDDDDDAYRTSNIDDDNYVATDDDVMNYYGRKGELELTSGYCESNATIDVEKVFLICDSPGAYYYGSGSYRDSARCKYGDKAKMHVYCKLLLRCGYVPGATPLN